jgi:hypothetical protein
MVKRKTRQKNKYWSTKYYTENQRLSNTSPKNKPRWFQVHRKGNSSCSTKFALVSRNHPTDWLCRVHQIHHCIILWWRPILIESHQQWIYILTSIKIVAHEFLRKHSAGKIKVKRLESHILFIRSKKTKGRAEIG